MAIHEECGVFGILSRKRERLGKLVYYGLYALQHRGQESCGIVVNDDGVFSSYKDLGLVSEVFLRILWHIFRKEIWPWDMCGTERQEEIIERIVSL